ncbi:MAG: DUF3737 family protein [Lachnospiraceae bacterium]|nr:DUF3737 family protein [Lachnospiraceae bacterium]
MDNMIIDKSFDEERALYGSRGLTIKNCSFDGPADGESALKESRDIEVISGYFNLRYPFWHDKNLKIEGSEMTENCRAALWYTDKAAISNTKLHGIKALRECSDITIHDCDIKSQEFGWSVKNIAMRDSSAESEYFMMRSDRLDFKNVTLKGKYSFQYIENSVFEDCDFDTKDAFWHGKNIVIKNSRIKGEYLAWYCENVTFENCTIIGTQPFCYCKGLKLINCRMEDADLAFEKSEVDALITTELISIKNPLKGCIRLPKLGELILTDEEAGAEVIVDGKKVNDL